jgi:hypothetical protein
VAAPARWTSGERQAVAGAGTRTSGGASSYVLDLLVERAMSTNLVDFFFSIMVFSNSPFRFFSSLCSSVSSVKPRNRSDETETELIGFWLHRTPIRC